MEWINLAHLIEATEAEGPGLRIALWVQGCLKRCKGCCNAHLLPIKPAQIVPVLELKERVKHIHAQYPDLEGITFLGGEPFLQAKGLAHIAKLCQTLGLSVMVFSGYLLEELQESQFKGTQALLEATDVLVDGEFEQDNPEVRRNWVGPTNQRFHYLSDRYDSSIETMPCIANEWRIDSKGRILANGLPFVWE
ncbi:4Fe-4S single cluster domain-containing protein [Helicobacter cynogastricus]|uniref:Anaerobic ribonucleoside-triphosphate reductase-activating protein n=1 Tax=Helicobacter cynogastricus TaxID=329937 RepID=A0A1R3UCT2_9HELI|nr:4Fe-4S single cluster domain-containing protein [Helicobacter cynogastricus]SFZ72116.1 OMP867 [Helicobacter cynogastricus]